MSVLLRRRSVVGAVASAVASAASGIGVGAAVLCAVGVLATLGAGCAGSTVRAQTGATADLIATARDNGAQRCAPVELAMAESHNDFAQHELDEGNYHDARSEAAVAETNAKLAIEKSPRDRCVDKDAPPPPPPPGPGDKDGDGLLDNVDKCPNDPEDKDGFEDEDGCPDPDNDKDGILDTADKCPLEPEDKDGFEDEDGCPDPDNDKDGILDAADKCPLEPEDKDGFEDDDGCPDPDNDKDGILDGDDKCPLEPGVPPDGCPKKYNLVVVTETKIELKQTVFFDTNKATIKKVSFALLDDVSQALIDNPKIKVEIGGHTDSQGNDSFNLKLSQKRAESVRTYLIKKGVTSDRLAPKGYGENVPIADNRTSDGRAQNRRVEFVITAR
jgi:OmpA-OmpF porin, OOP family